MNASSTERHARALLAGALATLGLTALHHVYGALRFDTPWRHHAAFIGLVGGVILWLAHRVYARNPARTIGRVGLWVLGLGAGVLAVLMFGIYEGFYNHVIKNLVYFAGLPNALYMRLFPPPTYEPPVDLFFELTGILQVVPAAVAGMALVRLARPLRAVTGAQLAREKI